ncbi:MAG: IS4/Tn5 family transposase DNA-binding protein, partial [Gammaproteobacteria bacterium]
MHTQNQIKRTLWERGGIAYVRELLESKAVAHRTELAKRVCEQYGLYDERGREQRSGCVKALREFEAGAHFKLPAPRRHPGDRSLRRLGEAVALAKDVPGQVGELGGLELVLVNRPEQMQVWNELMSREHPQGGARLVGRQLRYLIGSHHGWLGGFGFACAALQLADREAWIGWDDECRKRHLDKVVGMARFLIRPGVDCHNLASKVLSMSVAVLPDDFERHYGYRPWLVESFVDISRYTGSCYRAANWIAVGTTKGRGRQDRDNLWALTRKAIYVYPLVNDLRARLGLSADAGLGALEPGQGLDTAHWAENEFGGAQLGDVRVSRRLVKVAAAKAQVPDRAFSGVAKGDWAAVKAYYRMIDQPEESQLNMANILAAHHANTMRRMHGQKKRGCV